MGKSFFENTEEQRGSLPALTGALFKIKGIERTKTGENSKTPGCRMYVCEFEVVEPAEFAGTTVRDWIVVGTAEDPLAKRPETWARSEGGPGRLKRLLTRSGTPLSDDDEEWMEQAEGREIVTSVSARPDDSGQVRNRVGMFFRPTDEDCPDIEEADESAAPKGKAKGKGAAAAARSARGRTGAKGKEAEDEEDEEEEEKPKATDKSKAKGKGKAKSSEDEDADEDEDEKPKGKSKAAKKDDDEDDEDED